MCTSSQVSIHTCFHLLGQGSSLPALALLLPFQHSPTPALEVDGGVHIHECTRTITHPQACKFSQAISWNAEAQTLGTEGRLYAAEWLVETVGWVTVENISGAFGLLLQTAKHYTNTWNTFFFLSCKKTSLLKQNFDHEWVKCRQKNSATPLKSFSDVKNVTTDMF